MLTSKPLSRHDNTSASPAQDPLEVQLHILCHGQFQFADKEQVNRACLRPGSLELGQCAEVEQAIRLAQIKLYTLSTATIASMNAATGFQPELIEIRTGQGQLVVAAQYCYGELIWLWPAASTYEEGYLRFRIAMLEQRIAALEQEEPAAGRDRLFHSVDSLRRQAGLMRNRLSEPSYRLEVHLVLKRLAAKGRWIF